MKLFVVVAAISMLSQATEIKNQQITDIVDEQDIYLDLEDKENWKLENENLKTKIETMEKELKKVAMFQNTLCKPGSMVGSGSCLCPNGKDKLCVEDDYCDIGNQCVKKIKSTSGLIQLILFGHHPFCKSLEKHKRHMGSGYMGHTGAKCVCGKDLCTVDNCRTKKTCGIGFKQICNLSNCSDLAKEGTHVIDEKYIMENCHGPPRNTFDTDSVVSLTHNEVYNIKTKKKELLEYCDDEKNEKYCYCDDATHPLSKIGWKTLDSKKINEIMKKQVCMKSQCKYPVKPTEDVPYQYQCMQ